MPFISSSETGKPFSALVTLSRYTEAKNVAYSTSRITGVMSDTKNMPLSLKNTFMLRFVSARNVFTARLLRAWYR